MCPHVYRTQSGGCSRHTAHSLDELSSDSVFASGDPASSDGRGGTETWPRGPDGVSDTLRRGMVATGCVGGEGYDVTLENTVDGGGGACESAVSLRRAEWCDSGRGCFGGRDGGDCDDVDRTIGGGRGSGDSDAAWLFERRGCH